MQCLLCTHDTSNERQTNKQETNDLNMQAKQKHTRAKPTEKQTSNKYMAFCIVTCFDFLSEKQCSKKWRNGMFAMHTRYIKRTRNKPARNKRSANKQVCFWFLCLIHPKCNLCYAHTVHQTNDKQTSNKPTIWTCKQNKSTQEQNQPKNKQARNTWHFVS